MHLSPGTEARLPLEGPGRTPLRPGDILAPGGDTVLFVRAVEDELAIVRVIRGGDVVFGPVARRVRPACDLTVAVLAGGRSRRFGTDKRQAELDGKALMDRAVGLAREVAPTVLLSVGPGEGPQFNDLATVIEDDRADGGPLVGLAAVLSVVTTPWCAILPVDTPCLTPDVLRVLAALATPGGAVASDARGLHPLVAVFPVSAWQVARDALDRGERSIRAFLAGLDVRIIGPELLADLGDPTRLLANVNTVADLNALTKP